MSQHPVAVGGVGGSGTRVVAKILQDLGVFIGSDLPRTLDTVWYAALFGRRDILLEDPDDLWSLAELFFRQMASPRPLNADEHARLLTLQDLPRHQHTPDVVEEWLDGFIAHCATGSPARHWGWKVPYTHVLIDRFLERHPTLRYIHITRNGVDMAYSKNQNQLGKWGPVFLNRNVEITPRDSLKFWCAVQRRVARIQARFPDRVCQISFEQLVQDPGPHIDRIARFVGAELTAKQRDALCDFIFVPESVSRYKTQDLSSLDQEDVAYALQATASITAQDDDTGPHMTDTPRISALEDEILKTRTSRAGADNRRAYVGPASQYDFMGATQFNLLTGLGLREDHRVIDIGCGSLRAGRYLLQYLLPQRYTGIDPNAWLWREAIEKEIGGDLIALKQPRLLEDADFSMPGIADATADYIVAQSIYSHTGADLFRTSIEAAARCLAPSGQILFTAILPDAETSASMPDGEAYEGWLYPGCLTFTQDAVTEICTAAGLHVQKLPWYHPRQTWFRATLDENLLLSPGMFAALGTGKPLFDPRFT